VFPNTSTATQLSRYGCLDSSGDGVTLEDAFSTNDLTLTTPTFSSLGVADAAIVIPDSVFTDSHAAVVIACKPSQASETLLSLTDGVDTLTVTFTDATDVLTITSGAATDAITGVVTLGKWVVFTLEVNGATAARLKAYSNTTGQLSSVSIVPEFDTDPTPDASVLTINPAANATVYGHIVAYDVAAGGFDSDELDQVYRAIQRQMIDRSVQLINVKLASGYDDPDEFVTLDTVWCDYRPVSAYDQWRHDQMGIKVTHSVAMRYRSDITGDMRLVIDGKNLYVRGIKDPDNRQYDLELRVEER